MPTIAGTAGRGAGPHGDPRTTLPAPPRHQATGSTASLAQVASRGHFGQALANPREVASSLA